MASGKAARATGKKKSEPGIILGKGKVTPLQVAFIVDRYLADNSYANTLAAFRTEAADLFSKTKGKEVPKRLLGLAEMLDEFIVLKEQRVLLDQERRGFEMERQRVESALQGMQEVVHTYYSGGLTSVPLSSPQPPAAAAVSTTLPVPEFLPNSGSPPVESQTVNGVSYTSFIQPPTGLPIKLADPTNFLASASDSSSSRKRKMIKSSFDAPSAPNKPHWQVQVESSDVRVLSLSSPALTPEAETNLVAARGSFVMKSFCKQRSDYQVKSSPKTALKVEKTADSPIENPSSKINDSNSLKEIAPVNCSIITSETVIISPIKQTGYFVEKSYQISSQCKNIKDHARGKLDFYISNGHMRLEEPVKVGSSTSAYEEIPENFVFDLPDMDIFNGVSFTELLADIDLDCDLSSDPLIAPSVAGHEHSEGCFGCVGTNEVQLDSLHQKVLHEHSEDMKIKGLDSVTSVKTITKRIKFASPVKNISREQTKMQYNHSNSAVPTSIPDLI